MGSVKIWIIIAAFLLGIISVFVWAGDYSRAARITAQELKARMASGEKLIILDVRNDPAYRESNYKIPGSIRVPLEEVDKISEEIPKDALVIAYCT